MPVYLPPTSRRRFLAGSLATAAAVLFRDGLFAADPVAADPHRFALLSDVHIAADRAKVSRGVNMADNLAKGSGRSVAGLDLGAAVIAARQCGILKTGGGHPMAAGFSLLPERMADFHAFLDERLAAADARAECPSHDARATMNSLTARSPARR